VSTWRETGDRCPLDERPVHMDICQPCRFFRGAVLGPQHKGWKVNCNYPRDGSYIHFDPVPDAFREAFEK